jgi:hypothetical protein
VRKLPLLVLHFESKIDDFLRENGVFGLWHGILAKLFQAALQQALIFRIKDVMTRPMLGAVHRWYSRRPDQSE